MDLNAELHTISSHDSRPGGFRDDHSRHSHPRRPANPGAGAGLLEPLESEGEHKLPPMLTSARPRTLVLVVSDHLIDVAMLGPRGRELGVRQVVPIAAEAATVWNAIEQLGEFDRITLVGADPRGICEGIARESQRPLRQMTHGGLRWSRVISGDGVELALTLGSRFGAAVYHRGVELRGVDLGRQLVRKDRRVREYLAARVFERKGADAWLRRVARSVDELLGVWNPTALYIATPPTLPVPKLPPEVVVVPPRTSLEDALVAWGAAPDRPAAPGPQPAG
jgi:hypothetical protein